MIQEIPIESALNLGEYAGSSHLAEAVRTLRIEASMLVPPLRERSVWMVNSTAKGGGVAEMLPRMVTMLTEVGLQTHWAVISSDRLEFFRLTKRLHNLIHGTGNPRFDEGDRELYEAVNRKNAEELKPHLKPDDLLVIHDPQPLAMGAILKRDLGIRTVWRCHIGLDAHLPETRAAWGFLKPYAETYDLAIFSAPEYIPDYLAGRATIIHPALDPHSHKNRDLSPHKLVGVLCDSGLMRVHHPVVTPPFSKLAQRVGADGTLAPAAKEDEVGFLYRPVVAQVSRWDRLKGFRPLLEGFVTLKRTLNGSTQAVDARHHRLLELVRLVLAGPDPTSVQDDPEGREVFDELVEDYMELDPALQDDVALLCLPMDSRKENALMVNALQRCTTVAVQNSIQEGFGLTATEAMWKGVPVIGTRACGLRQQVRNGIDGVLIHDPEDPAEIAKRLDDLLKDVHKRERMARNAQQRVHEEFLIFKQLCQWLRCLSDCASAPPRGPETEEPL
jgi:trehalose synthase